jgi:hypothetical protein
MTAAKVTRDSFKVSSLWPSRLREHQISIAAILRRAGLPAAFFQQERNYATTAELLESHFGCRVRFKAGRNAPIFRNSDLDRPFVTQNEELLKAIGAQLEAELNEAASLLGCENSNSCFRAFQGWEGTTLGEWRTQHRTAQVALPAN